MQFRKELTGSIVLRRLIRIRDNDLCQICSTKKIGKRNLDVHHIDGNKKNNKSENLITLCHTCHLNVDYWKNPRNGRQKVIHS